MKTNKEDNTAILREIIKNQSQGLTETFKSIESTLFKNKTKALKGFSKPLSKFEKTAERSNLLDQLSHY